MPNQPPSEGFRSLLTTHVGTSGWELHTGQMPRKPDRIISITDTGGLPANPKWLLDFPTVQVMIRGKVGDYIAAYQEGKAVKDILLGLPSQDINDDRWDSITLNGDLGYIGRDENDRPLFTINFALIIEPQSVPNSNRFSL